MNRLQIAAITGVAVALLFVGLFLFLQKKPDPGPVQAPERPEPSAEPPKMVEIKPIPEDASDEADGPDADAKPTGTGAYDPSRMKACCAALQANAASMPSPQNMYAAAAAQYCMASVASINSSGQKDQVLAGIRNALRGGTLPANCR